MSQLPPIPEEDPNLSSRRLRLSRRARLTIAFIVVLLALMILLHLTGVINESSVGH